MLGVRNRRPSQRKRARRCARHGDLDGAGPVWFNAYTIFDAALAFDGYKQSGWGREMGEEVIHEYTETTSVCIGL